jgi:hypothetical protein
MRTLLAVTALLAVGTPNLTKLVLRPTQIGTGYVLFRIKGGSDVRQSVTLNLCGVKGYPSEAQRIARYQVSYLKRSAPIGISNEVVYYAPGGAAQAMREVREHARTCPDRPIDTGVPSLPKLRFTITRLHSNGLLPGALAVRIRTRGTVAGKHVDETSYAVYQRWGDVLSGMYSIGPNNEAQLALLLHAAEQSALNLRIGHNFAVPSA